MLQHNESIHRYLSSDVDLLLGFANQAALAIEHSRYYEQAQTMAVVEERQRLARDLHDAVSQTLFSASLAAEVLPQLWERNQAEARHCLQEVRQLTRSALTEMRTLLLELRPEILPKMEFNELLSQLAEAIGNRFRLPLDLAAEKLPPLPPDVQIALYRISQEALNNIGKHATASRVTVGLRLRELFTAENKNLQRAGLELRISDNGQGFDPQNVSSGSLGLGIMHERAKTIGANLRIESQVGHGTEVIVIWPEL